MRLAMLADFKRDRMENPKLGMCGEPVERRRHFCVVNNKTQRHFYLCNLKIQNSAEAAVRIILDHFDE